MSFLLITGLIFLIMPALIVLGLALAMFVFFLRDDRDAKAVLNILIGSMVFGVFLIIAHLFGKAL